MEQPGSRELAPFPGERQAAQSEKRSKNSDFISLVFCSTLGCRMVEGLSRKTRLDPWLPAKRSRTEFGAGPWWVFDMRVRLY